MLRCNTEQRKHEHEFRRDTLLPRPPRDTYIAVLVRLLEIGDKLKIQSVAMKHARNCNRKQDWRGVQLALAMFCACAQDIRKIAAAVNEKIEPDMDDATQVYGE